MVLRMLILKMNQKPLTWKKVALIFRLILGIILLFSLIDFFIHKLSNEYAVPDFYFRNKIIFGTLIGFLSYFFLRKQTVWPKTLLFSAIISISLQIRYYLEGYPKDFVFLFLGIHFVILVVVSWPCFRFTKNYL